MTTRTVFGAILGASEALSIITIVAGGPADAGLHGRRARALYTSSAHF